MPEPLELEEHDPCRACDGESGEAGFVIWPASPSSLSASNTKPRSSSALMTLSRELNGTRMKSE